MMLHILSVRMHNILPYIYSQNTGPWNARSATVLGQRGAWVFSTQDAVRGDVVGTTAEVSVSRISTGDALDLTPAGE